MKMRLEHAMLISLSACLLLVVLLACPQAPPPPENPTTEQAIHDELMKIPPGAVIDAFCSQGFICGPTLSSFGCSGGTHCMSLNPPNPSSCCATCRCWGSQHYFCLSMPCTQP